MNKINHVIAKPAKPVMMGDYNSIVGGAYVEVPQGDNGILIIVDAKEGGNVIFEAGDSVLAGGDWERYLDTGVWALYVESGPFLHTQGEKKGRIYFRTRGEEMYATVVELN